MEYSERVKQHEARILEKYKSADGDLPIFTPPELLETPYPQPRDGDTWGMWRFQQSNLTLQFDSGKYEYEIDLEVFDTPISLPSWLWHLMGKSWATPELIGHLVRALYELSDSTYWEPAGMDLTAKIRARYKGGHDENKSAAASGRS